MTVRPVVVVGDVGLDVLVRPQTGVVRGGDTPSDVRIVPGGAGGNTAAWLASAGVPVALVSRVGDDDAGAAARRRLESDGVVCRFATDPVLPTCTVVVLLEDDERTMLPDRGANAALSPGDLDLAGAAAELSAAGVTAGIPHLHLSGFVLLDPRSRPAGVAALESARSLGWTTSVDPQAANHVERVGADAFLGWAEGVDLLLPNEIEAQALGGDDAMLERREGRSGVDGGRWGAVGDAGAYLAGSRAGRRRAVTERGAATLSTRASSRRGSRGRDPRRLFRAGSSSAAGPREGPAPGPRPARSEPARSEGVAGDVGAPDLAQRVGDLAAGGAQPERLASSGRARCRCRAPRLGARRRALLRRRRCRGRRAGPRGGPAGRVSICGSTRSGS